ncbi:MAG: right-handed parallel beta-helix repeat-containing protein [Prevotellaceae bacterium]|nr:right-handed parallel beta-helix repeat-containing protein [Prevotellaceae bacterium]
MIRLKHTLYIRKAWLRKSISTWLMLIVLSCSACMADDFCVVKFGAKGDGKTNDTYAINSAIEASSAKGGGCVVIPKGVYLSHSIHLKSNITLQLDEGAIIKAAPVTDSLAYDNPEQNTSTYQDFGHSHWQNSLIWGIGLHNVKITGKGMIDGTGVLSRGGVRKGYTGPSIANKAIALKDCKEIEISDLSFKSCGHFALLLTGVDDTLIDGLTIDTNRDGIDIDCCQNVVVRNCKVNTLNDDAIVLKCSYALGWAKPTENVLIEDCHVSGFDVGSLIDETYTTNTQKAPDRDGPTGRIKLGTESNGGFRDITIRNCTFEHCRGLALESVDGAAMENINVSGIKMNDICNSPIYIRLGSRMRGPNTLSPSVVRNISISDVTVTDADCRYACLIAGEKGHPVKDVTLKNINIQYRGGITLNDYHNQRGTNPFFYHDGGNYPEPSAHGIQPAWGLSATYAEGIVLDNVKFELLSSDERPMIYKKHVKRMKIRK